VTAGTLPQFTGIANGVLSLSPEVWPSNLGDVYPKAKAEGKLEEIGELGLELHQQLASDMRGQVLPSPLIRLRS
jgi:ABC-type proline/glycine betaine transport system substrate-binding protein